MGRRVLSIFVLLLFATAPLPAVGKDKVLSKPQKVLPKPEEKTALTQGATASSPALSGTDDDQYKICIGDTIGITVCQEADLSGDYEVRKDGTIKYPVLGAVKVEGLTKREVENKMYQLLEKDYLVDPLVYVNLRSYNERKIYILGCVEKPGPYSFPEGKKVTVLQAITQAGGLTRLASTGGVRVVRTDKNGKKVAINPRLEDVMRGKHDDLELEPNDMIIAPERLF
jgi:protein involved in polysaccharide export with SLBB domain